MRLRSLLLTLILFLLGQSAIAQDQRRVDYDQSSLSFVLQSGGNPITGKFSNWRADLVLSADEANDAGIKVEVDVTSAKTGNPLVDAMLHTVDWLDSEHHSTSLFMSQLIEADEIGGFHVEGQLSIKGIAHPVTLTVNPYAPSPDTTAAVTQGAIYLVEGLLDRFAYNIGADFDAEIASQQVRIVGHIVLAP